MPILNYTTKITATKTVSEIQQMLIRRGVRKIVTDLDDDGQVKVITFHILSGMQPLYFVLECNSEGVLKILEKEKVERRYRTKEHANNVAWRILKDWIESQLSLVDADLMKMEELFLSKLLTGSGQTLFQLIESGRSNLLLASGV